MNIKEIIYLQVQIYNSISSEYSTIDYYRIYYYLEQMQSDFIIRVKDIIKADTECLQ